MENQGETVKITPLISLISRELSAVVFVRDYLQLEFDGLGITYNLFPLVQIAGSIWNADNEEYRNKLCEQIGKNVVSFSAEKESLNIYFSDGSSILLSFSYEDLDLPEIVIIQDENKVTVVI